MLVLVLACFLVLKKTGMQQINPRLACSLASKNTVVALTVDTVPRDPGEQLWVTNAESSFTGIQHCRSQCFELEAHQAVLGAVVDCHNLRLPAHPMRF